MASGSCGSSWEREGEGKMADDYLWDPTAAPDPEIERLEALLRPAAYRATPLRAAEMPRRRRHLRMGVWAALAAAVVLAAGGAFVVRRARGAHLIPWAV